MPINLRIIPFFVGVWIVAGTLAVAQDTSKKSPKPEASNGLPNVLILGDSISIGYTPVVTELLKGKANVFRPRNAKGRPENCAGTENGIKHVDRWLSAGNRKWDVIHFNFGLHDLKRVHPETRKNSNDTKHPRQSEPDAYKKQLQEIVRKLLRTKAKVIFATTTPVPPGGVKPHRDITDPKKYNDIAMVIMKDAGIAINDLYQLANAKQKEIMRPVNVHFTREGSQVLGKQVAEAIRKALMSKPKKKE